MHVYFWEFSVLECQTKGSSRRIAGSKIECDKEIASDLVFFCKIAQETLFLIFDHFQIVDIKSNLSSTFILAEFK